MRKEAFYKKMLALYASTANTERKQEIVNAYETVLDADTDFELLYKTVLKEHQTNAIPTAAWLNQKKRRLPSENTPKSSIYWTIWGQTKSGMVYEFACRPEETLEEAIITLESKKPFPLTYLRDNRDEIRCNYGI